MKTKTKLTKEEITFKVLLVAVFAVIACYFVPQAIKTLNPYWLLGFCLFFPFVLWKSIILKIWGEQQVNKKLAQRCLKGFYWLGGISTWGLITIGLTYWSRASLQPSTTWGHRALGFFFGMPAAFALLFLVVKLHIWAFNTQKEVAKEEKQLDSYSAL